MPEKVFPYCPRTVNGHCEALNKEGFAVLQSELADEAYKNGDLEGAAELQMAAGEIRSEISYCRRCPLRMKKESKLFKFFKKKR